MANLALTPSQDEFLMASKPSSDEAELTKHFTESYHSIADLACLLLIF